MDWKVFAILMMSVIAWACVGVFILFLHYMLSVPWVDVTDRFLSIFG